MKFIYFANHGNKGSDDTEAHITSSLHKLGHEVVRVSEGHPENVPAEGNLILLFHKGGSHINNVLEKVKYPKVCWYFDKVWNDRVRWMEQMIPKVTMMAMTDEAWARRNPAGNIRIIRQGIGDILTEPGKPSPNRFGATVAFTGSIYGERRKWAEGLKKRYLGQFQGYNEVFNRDLCDFCATVPIIVAPGFPSEDYYWSSRIYITLGSGGFMVHPRLAGLENEYQDGIHYAGYSTEEEMYQKIDYYLEHKDERKKIQKAGYDKTISEFTYTKRVEQLLNKLAPYVESGNKN